MAIFPIVSIRIRTVFGRLVWWIQFFLTWILCDRGYVDWFQMVVKLILEKLPDDSRAIFMQTDVKAGVPLQKNEFANFTRQLGWFIYGGRLILPK